MELSDNQKKTVIIFTFILGCAIIVMGLLTNYWFLHSLPPMPSLVVGGERTADSIKQEIDNYKTLTAVIKDNQSYLNDMLVVKFMKVLFDSLLVGIIAYLFGKPVILAIANRIKGNW